MKSSVLRHLVDPLRGMLTHYSGTIREYNATRGLPTAGLACDFLPVEILAAARILPLRLPARFMGGCVQEGNSSSWGEAADLFDCLIFPDRCCLCSRPFPGISKVCLFPLFEGYGEEASVKLHEEMQKLLSLQFGINLDEVDMNLLAEITEGYNVLRRTVRGIASMRQLKPALLSQDDLLCVFEAAACLPVDLVQGPLSALLDALNDVKSETPETLLPVLVNGPLLYRGDLLDDLEEEGCLIVEDDLCNGRRQFDPSYNTASRYIYYEIINSFTYRPLCPSLRTARERYDLLYKLLKNYGIETVLFLEESCGPRREEFESLRIRLMRSGIDPVSLPRGTEAAAVRDYLGLLKKGVMFPGREDLH